jgi:hypothetical protein
MHTLNGVLARTPTPALPTSFTKFPHKYITSHKRLFTKIVSTFCFDKALWSGKLVLAVPWKRHMLCRRQGIHNDGTMLTNMRGRPWHIVDYIEHKSADLASVIQAINGFVYCVSHSWCIFFSFLWRFFVFLSPSCLLIAILSPSCLLIGAQLFLKEVIRWMKTSHPEHLIKVLIKRKGDGGHHLLLCLMNPKL